jgi:hypothetical protein
MDAKQFLEEQLPPILGRPEVAAQAQQVGAVFLLVLTGERGGRWTLDLKSSPPGIHSGATAPAQVTLKLAAKDFEAILAEPPRAFELFFQGKLELSGDPALAGRLPVLMGVLGASASHGGGR